MLECRDSYTHNRPNNKDKNKLIRKLSNNTNDNSRTVNVQEEPRNHTVQNQKEKGSTKTQEVKESNLANRELESGKSPQRQKSRGKRKTLRNKHHQNQGTVKAIQKALTTIVLRVQIS